MELYENRSAKSGDFEERSATKSGDFAELVTEN